MSSLKTLIHNFSRTPIDFKSPNENFKPGRPLVQLGERSRAFTLDLQFAYAKNQQDPCRDWRKRGHEDSPVFC